MKGWWRKEKNTAFDSISILLYILLFNLFFVVNSSEIPNINKKQTNNTTPNPHIRTSGRVEISLVKLPYCLYLDDALCSESFGPGEEEMNRVFLVVSFLDKQE